MGRSSLQASFVRPFQIAWRPPHSLACCAYRPLVHDAGVRDEHVIDAITRAMLRSVPAHLAAISIIGKAVHGGWPPQARLNGVTCIDFSTAAAEVNASCPVRVARKRQIQSQLTR
jgi:hypothetical protein